eukprot:5293536-Amphidinium_carterae.1
MATVVFSHLDIPLNFSPQHDATKTATNNSNYHALSSILKSAQFRDPCHVHNALHTVLALVHVMLTSETERSYPGLMSEWPVLST